MGLSCQEGGVSGLFLFLTPQWVYYLPTLSLALAIFHYSFLGVHLPSGWFLFFSVMWNIPSLPFFPSWLSFLYSCPLYPTGLFPVTIHYMSRDALCLQRVPPHCCSSPLQSPTTLSLMRAPCLLRTLIEPASSLSKTSLLFLCNVSRASCMHSANSFWVKPGTVLDTGIKQRIRKTEPWGSG